LLTATGLYITAKVQQGQEDITRQNNDAQIRIALAKNAADLRLEELKTAAGLMEPLLSDNKRKRQMALVMLPRSISDPEISQQILFIATHDSEPEVRTTAIAAMAQSNTTAVAAALQSVAADTNRPTEERKLASTAAVQVGLRAVTPTRSAVFFASQPGAVAYDAPELGGGLFTYAVLKGLTTGTDTSKAITLSGLAQYLSSEIPVLSRQFLGSPSTPYSEISGNGDDPVLRAPSGIKQNAFVVGVGDYIDRSIPSIRYAASDAERFAGLMLTLCKKIDGGAGVFWSR
jgi:hypothetical protein